MPEVKPSAVGVTPKYVHDQPRILIAFFLDTPDIQKLEDDSGRPMALASFEPEAAYVTLAKKIKEARESLRRMAGVTAYVSPYLSMATLCESVMHEENGILSLIRLIDVFYFTSDGHLPPDHHMALVIKGLLQFRGGPETFIINLTIYGPNEERLVSATADVVLHGGAHSHSVRIEIPVAIKGEGLYRLDAFRENEQLATLPFQVRRALHQPSPSSQS